MLGYFKVIEVRDRCRFKMNVLGFGVRLFVDMFIHRHQILFELNWMHHRCTRSWCRKNFRCRKLYTKNFVHQKLLHKKKFVNRKLHEKLSSTGSCTKKNFVSGNCNKKKFRNRKLHHKIFMYRKLHHNKFQVPEVAPNGSSGTGSTGTALLLWLRYYTTTVYFVPYIKLPLISKFIVETR